MALFTYSVAAELLSRPPEQSAVARGRVTRESSGTYPLVEADNGPQTAPDCAAAAQAATEKPLHIDGQVLLQASVHPADAGFEFFWRYLRGERSSRPKGRRDNGGGISVQANNKLRSEGGLGWGGGQLNCVCRWC